MLQEEIGGLTFHTAHEQASFGSEPVKTKVKVWRVSGWKEYP